MRVRFVHCPLSYVIAAAAITVCFGQHLSADRFNEARQRAQDAEKILSSLSALMPKEIRAKAVGIGAFRCRKTDLVLEHAIICPGVISGRTANGWTTPAFFRVVAGGVGRAEGALTDADQLVLIFTANPPVDWLTRLKEARHAETGPLKSVPSLDQTFFSSSHVFAYVRRKEEWRGDNWKSGFWRSAGVAEDNDINNRLYGSKGHDVLAQKTKRMIEMPAEILAFQNYLMNDWNSVDAVPSR